MSDLKAKNFAVQNSLEGLQSTFKMNGLYNFNFLIVFQDWETFGLMISLCKTVAIQTLKVFAVEHRKLKVDFIGFAAKKARQNSNLENNMFH